MKRLAPIFAVVSLLAFAPGASARPVEMGTGVGVPAGKPACPGGNPSIDPCSVMARTTGYQGRIGNLQSPFVFKSNGKVVAFTVSLSKPNPTQIDFFRTGGTNGIAFGEPRIQLSILSKGRRRRTRLTHRLEAKSPEFRVASYFGSSPTFALDRAIKVKKGQIAALTTRSWAPVLEVRGLSAAFWWRSSRHKSPAPGCANIGQRSAQQFLRGKRIWQCTYRRGRLIYSVTFVPDPKPTT